jgi:hypothetical protein
MCVYLSIINPLRIIAHKYALILQVARCELDRAYKTSTSTLLRLTCIRTRLSQISTFSLGTLGPSVFNLNLKASCLTILFFNLLSTLPVAYFAVFGPRLGLRQMTVTRFSFGYYGARVFASPPYLLESDGLFSFSRVAPRHPQRYSLRRLVNNKQYVYPTNRNFH